LLVGDASIASRCSLDRATEPRLSDAEAALGGESTQDIDVQTAEIERFGT